MFGLGKNAQKVSPAVAPVVPLPEAYALSEYQSEALAALEVKEDGTVNLGDLARNVLGIQSQHIARYVDPAYVDDRQLVDGLRVTLANGNYHQNRIHQEDALELVARIRQFFWNTGRMR
jgi:hypothetical protein